MTERIIRLSVEGIKCNGCVKNVDGVLRSIAGISDVSVSLADKTVEVRRTGQPAVQELISVLGDAGYKAEHID